MIFHANDVNVQKYYLDDLFLIYLHVPAAFITAIQAKEQVSKLLILADFASGEINDEHRYDIDYFTKL